MNAKLSEEKRAHNKELEALKADMERQRKDIELLRKQLHSRDEQIGELSTKLRAVRVSTPSEGSSRAPTPNTGGRLDRSWHPAPLSPGSENSPDRLSQLSPGASPSRLRALAQPLPSRARAKSVSDGVAKSHLDWVIHHAKQTPGPAQYRPESAGLPVTGGKFNASKPKSDLEWKIHRAKSIPGPGEYVVKQEKKKTGAFSTAKPKSDLEWKIYHASQLPGPGEYKPANLDELKTGGFSTAKPKSELEWQIHRAKQLPGPGEYKIKEKKKTTGAFSTAKPKSDLEWKIYHAKQIPGPAEYEVAKATEPVSGGKFNASRSKSELEWVMYRAAQVPGAGSYDVAKADKLTKKSGHTGQFPFVYKPTNPALAHLAKGIAAIVHANRVKNIASAMLTSGGSGFGGASAGNKKVSEMSAEEKRAFEEERNAEVERTRVFLARVEKRQKERAERLERGEPLDGLEDENAPPPAKKLGRMLVSANKSGVLEDTYERMQQSGQGEGGETSG